MNIAKTRSRSCLCLKVWPSSFHSIISTIFIGWCGQGQPKSIYSSLELLGAAQKNCTSLKSGPSENKWGSDLGFSIVFSVLAISLQLPMVVLRNVRACPEYWIYLFLSKDLIWSNSWAVLPSISQRWHKVLMPAHIYFKLLSIRHILPSFQIGPPAILQSTLFLGDWPLLIVPFLDLFSQPVNMLNLTRAIIAIWFFNHGNMVCMYRIQLPILL